MDDKLLTSWNSLTIAALCSLYRVSGNREYLDAARRAERFIAEKLCAGETLFVSYRDGKTGGKGFLDEYACYVFALLSLYGATLRADCLQRAKRFLDKAVRDFADTERGGFYLYGAENEQLIARPKETYDGAIPCGNSLMTYNLVRLNLLTGAYREEAERQLSFMSAAVRRYPSGGSFFLCALSDFFDPPEKITAVVKDMADLRELPLAVSLDTVIAILAEPTEEYRLVNGQTTYYVCKDHCCLPSVNSLNNKGRGSHPAFDCITKTTR